MRLSETVPELGKNRPELAPDEEKKEAWLKKLAEFIVEANQNTWAADKGKVIPQRPGCKELDYEKGDWHLRDSYTGYFRAPGMTIIYYKGQPAWTMAYGGSGMEEDKYETTGPTFDFLKAALMKVTPQLPYRGPRNYKDGEYQYKLRVKGDLADFDGKEMIFKDKELVFSQLIFGGVVINKDSSKHPVYPWPI